MVSKKNHTRRESAISPHTTICRQFPGKLNTKFVDEIPRSFTMMFGCVVTHGCGLSIFFRQRCNFFFSRPFPCPHSQLKIWSCETSLAVPSRVRDRPFSKPRLDLVTHGLLFSSRFGRLRRPPCILSTVTESFLTSYVRLWTCFLC